MAEEFSNLELLELVRVKLNGNARELNDLKEIVDDISPEGVEYIQPNSDNVVMI